MYIYIMFVYIMYYSTLTLTVLRISGITNFAMFSIAQIWRCAVYSACKPFNKSSHRICQANAKCN